MRFITALAGFMLTSFVAANPVALPAAVANLEARIAEARVALTERDELCQVGVPCVVSYEVNVALDAVTKAVALINASAHAAISPTDPVVISLQAAVTVLVKVLGEVTVEVGDLAGEAKAELRAYIVAAIRVAIGQIRAGVAIVISVAASAQATITPKVTESAQAILTVIVAIEAVVGPCVPPSP